MDVRIISITPVCQYDAEIETDGDLLVETGKLKQGHSFILKSRSFSKIQDLQ